MLQPSENFSAEQVRFLQNGATAWIEYVNSKIIEAAGNGDNQVSIDITDRDEVGKLYKKAASTLVKHFEKRGFEFVPNGQSSVKFKW